MPRKNQQVAIQQDSDSLAELMSEINDKFGGGTLVAMEGTSGRWPEDKIIRTGSLSLDMAIGIGGWPRGRLCQIHGMESSGKTTQALLTVKQAQEQGIQTVYIDAESALDTNWMKRLGIDTTNVPVSQPANLEVAIDLMVTLMETGKVGLIVFDSIAAMKSAHVMESEASTETRALEARRWSAQLPRVVKAAKDSNTTVLFINQMRDSMSMYGAPTSLPGGKTLKFGMSLMVEIKKVLEGRNNYDGVDYHEANFKVIKNKVGSPFVHGEWYIYPGSSEVFDYEEDVIVNAIRYGVIQEDTKYEEDDDGLYTVSKKGWFALKMDPQLLRAVREDEPEFDADVLQVYQNAKFSKRLRELPTLVEMLEQRVLNTLNRGFTEEVVKKAIRYGEVLVDTKFEENEDGDIQKIDKKGWHAIRMDEDLIDSAREDNPEFDSSVMQSETREDLIIQLLQYPNVVDCLKDLVVEISKDPNAISVSSDAGSGSDIDIDVPVPEGYELTEHGELIEIGEGSEEDDSEE